MREYGKVAPQFWTGETGRAIRELGGETQRVALYLLTGPNANMLGLYHLPFPLIPHHLGSPSQGASKALRSLEGVGFAFYDAAEEVVWVPEMARFQIAEHLQVGDNRIAGIINELLTLRRSRFLKDFVDRYAERYHLRTAKRWEALARALEAPSKPLRSQEQEQEQEQEREEGGESESLSAAPTLPSLFTPKELPPTPDKLAEAWNTAMEGTPIPKARLPLSDKRARTVRLRLKSRPWAQWLEAIGRIALSDFCRGKNDRGWVATFDFLLQADTPDKALEGKYDNRTPVNPSRHPRDVTSSNIAAMREFVGEPPDLEDDEARPVRDVTPPRLVTRG